MEKKFELLKNARGYLGIDVSKGYSDFVLMDSGKRKLEKCFQLDDNLSGHKRLEKLLKEFSARHDLGELYCGVESTGGYENNWHRSLISLSENMPLKVARLNPRGVQANSEAMLSRNKTDGLSAEYIAEYMISHPEKIEFNNKQTLESRKEPANYDSMRSVYKYIRMLKKQKGQLTNQLHMIIYRSFPELVSYCKDGIPSWLLELLMKYPSPEKMIRAGKNKLKKIKYITDEKAEKIIIKAKETIGKTDSYIENLLLSLSTELKHKEELIDRQKKLLEVSAQGEEVEILVSMKGIGKYSAACMVIEIEDVNRFSNTKKICSYYGLHPVLKDSGDMSKGHRMSKKGRPGMREVLYMVAKSAACCNPHIAALYKRCREKGMKYNEAIGVCMHKILRIVYGMLKNKQVYNSQVDMDNMAKNHKEPIDSAIKDFENRRRYQEANDEAPISNRNYRKRKALYLSQSNEIAEYGIMNKVPVANV